MAAQGTATFMLAALVLCVQVQRALSVVWCDLHSYCPDGYYCCDNDMCCKNVSSGTVALIVFGVILFVALITFKICRMASYCRRNPGVQFLERPTSSASQPTEESSLLSPSTPTHSSYASMNCQK